MLYMIELVQHISAICFIKVPTTTLLLVCLKKNDSMKDNFGMESFAVYRVDETGLRS